MQILQNKLFTTAQLVISALFLISLSTLINPLSASAATTNYRALNSFMLQASCDGEACYWQHSTNWGNKPTGALSESGFFFRTSLPDDTCEDVIFKETRTSNWQRYITPKASGACSSSYNEPIGISVDESGLRIYWFQNSDNDIVPIAGGATWKRVPGSTMSTAGIPNLTELYINTSRDCPTMLLGYSSGTWGYIAPRKYDTLQTQNESKYYRDMVAAAAPSKADSVGGCRATNWMQTKGWNLDSLASELSRDRDWFDDTDQRGPFISLNGSLSGIYSFKNKPFGNARFVTVVPSMDGDGVESCPDGMTPSDGRCLAREPNTESDTTSSCAVQGIGWIVCPVMNFLGRLNDAAFDFLANSFLETESRLINDEATKKAWESFRNIANIMFVIAFLAIVYGQMTGGRK